MKPNIDFSHGFQCRKCGSSPCIVIMDGTALSFRRDLDFWSDTDLTLKGEQLIPKGSFDERIFLPNHKTRKLLVKYVLKGLSDAEMQDLNMCVMDHAPTVIPLLEFLEANHTVHRDSSNCHQCPISHGEVSCKRLPVSPLCVLQSLLLMMLLN